MVDFTCSASAFKNLAKSGIFKMHGKKDSSRFWSGMMGFWAFPKQNPTLNKRNLVKKWQTGMRNRFLGKVPHNLD